jgi:rhodanese-related sulfurtransferase
MNSKRTIWLLLTFLIFLPALDGSSSGRAETSFPADQERLFEVVTPKEAYDLIQKNRNNPDFIILDVRTPDEFKEEHIEGAINIDYYLGNFKDEVNRLDKGKTYLIYCRTGRRSSDAFNIMRQLGFRQVYEIKGGTLAWKSEKLPLTPKAE